MSERLPRVTERAVLAALARDGWYIARQRTHAVLRHPTKPGRVVVPRHRGKTLKPGTLDAIIEDAGLTPEEFRRLL
ncbi:MAG TPA: type II toxin-antitoxin system HicA family toxin [Chloroflexota bacterium]|jgi:predicted RNA binding protein YcfA (HicA-like mRNA interferase family)